MIRNTAAAMLMRLGERDDATMSAVRSILARGDDWGVLWRLEEMGPDGSWAVEDVARLALRSEKNLIHYARALGAIASAGDAGAVALEKRLAEGKKPGRDRLTQFTVAQALIAVDPQNASGQGVPVGRPSLKAPRARPSVCGRPESAIRAVASQLVDVRPPTAASPALHGLGDAERPAPSSRRSSMVASLIERMDQRPEPASVRVGLGMGQLDGHRPAPRQAR
jgi:hypothetical protein